MNPEPTSDHDSRGAAPWAMCVNCEAEIRSCAGDAGLPKWKGSEAFHGCCRFGGYVHASGKRPGSHLCGKDWGPKRATPAPLREAGAC